MSSDSRSDNDYEREVQALLAHAVREEIGVWFGMEPLELPDASLDRLTQALVSRIDYAFRFRWDPSWAKDAPHVWNEVGRSYARCATCLWTSPPGETPELARLWYAEHVEAEHGG